MLSALRSVPRQAKRPCAPGAGLRPRAFGRPSVRVDVHVPVDNTPIFGGAGGTFRQSAGLDSRLVVVPIDDGLPLVLVQAKPDDLEAAWAQSLEILETVQL